MPGFSVREIGHIETSYTSALGQLSWTWVMRADGTVMYRLSHVDGRPERNDWQLVCRLTSTERRSIGTDTDRANDLLTRVARQRGHYPAPASRQHRAPRHH
jgi:hypothetical protein